MTMASYPAPAPFVNRTVDAGSRGPARCRALATAGQVAGATRV